MIGKSKKNLMRSILTEFDSLLSKEQVEEVRLLIFEQIRNRQSAIFRDDLQPKYFPASSSTILDKSFDLTFQVMFVTESTS